MKKQLLLWLGWLLLGGGTVFTQSTFPPHGLHRNPSTVHAFINCNLVPSPGDTIRDGILVIREGLVENLGKRVNLPPDAAVHDLKGAWVYPGLIDIYASYGIGKKKSGSPPRRPQYKGSRSGAYAWNDAVKPDHLATDELKHDEKSAKKWRGLGFTTVHTIPNDGIFRGQAALLNLGNGSLGEDLLMAETVPCMSFNKGISKQQYPSSLMGSIALIRQTFLDARWYAEVAKVKESKPSTPGIETNLALQKLVDIGKQKPYFFECRDHQDLFRAVKIFDEFRTKVVLKGSGDEYQRLTEVKKLDCGMIVPLNFPKKYDLSKPADAREVSLKKLMHWEQAPTNPARLAAAEISFALTTADLKNPAKEFWPALYKAVQHGLAPEEALAALTTRPAEMLGMGNRIGTLTPGKIANFIVVAEPLFESAKPVFFSSYVAGQGYDIKEIPLVDVRGKWQLNAGDLNYELWISGDLHAPKLKSILNGDTLAGKVSLSGLNIDFNLPKGKGADSKVKLNGIFNAGQARGTGVMPEGEEIRWTLVRNGDLDPEYLAKEAEKKAKKKAASKIEIADIPVPIFPFGPYGNKDVPKAETALIKDVTVWTNTDQGKLENTDVLIQNGRIAKIGKGLSAPSGVVLIDGRGKHLTPGIIDEHSHIAISRGVNEGSHASSAEVRIGDVVDATDVDIYRQLAGGVTTSQLLHGSANPIGGQSAIIKLRWGVLPEAMKMETASPFIKFALGENVKQSNWGDEYRSRYPQTRLGVEQFFRDNFQAALDYRKAWEEAEKGFGNGLPVRRDLQLETVLEIIDSKRFVTCHSYVQSEITMLMRVAESFGFRINTFTHVLEGYKVADKIAAHGATGSTFSDWWAYKYEVIDAIPHNAAIMNEAGVNVCINSDDAEMARRLNQEAAKAVKYGGMSEEDALKLVTLNPAKALRIDDRVGSIANGKDADVVLWSDHPLSIYATAEKTWVDGIRYFDQDQDLMKRKFIAEERMRLTKKMMKDGKKGGMTPAKEAKKHYHCDTFESDYNHE